MDAAAAAAMSDPDLNPHFRRRWDEGRLDAAVRTSRPANTAIGTLGIALQDASRLANGQATPVQLRKSPEGPTNG